MAARSNPAARRRRWQRGALPRAVLLGAAVLAALVAYKGLRLYPHGRGLICQARVFQALAGKGATGLGSTAQLAQAREALGETRRDLQHIRGEIAPLLFLAKHLGWVPWIGGDLEAAPALLDVAVELCDAGWWGLLGAEPALDAAREAPQGQGRIALEAALPALAVARPRFAEAQQAVARARAARERVDEAGLSPALARWVRRLDRYLPLLEGGTRLAQRAPALLGQERPVTYLVLAQNNQELRPTGGFISGAGLIQVSKGKVISSSFEDSYRVDARCDVRAHPPAPPPLQRHMWAPVLMFRDANWSPDFATSAVVASSILRRCRGAEVDGVIAVDLDAVAALLGALGPLQPAGYPAPVTGQTLLEYVDQYWTAPLRSDSIEVDQGEWWTHRKDFMADLLGAALARITVSPQSIDARQLALALLEAGSGKHLLVYLRDPEAAQAVAAAGRDGSLRASDGDYLMVVDSNLGFRKVNPHIRQAVDYQITMREGRAPVARLTVRYSNESTAAAGCIAGSSLEGSYQAMTQGCYWDYVRVYAPPGSRLLTIEGGDGPAEAGEEAGKAVFSTFLVVAPGQTRELALSYELPSRLAVGSRYSLVVQKQPGSASIPVRVRVSGSPWRLWHSAPGLASAAAGAATFDLDTDVELEWVAGEPRLALWGLIGGGLALLLPGLALLLGPRRGGAARAAPPPAQGNSQQRPALGCGSR